MRDEKIEQLEREVVRQWSRNHDDSCCGEWPHTGECEWPLPMVLIHKSEEEILEIVHSD